jgi:two-component system sensor histidine kinase KdpD
MLIRMREFRDGPRGRWLAVQLIGVLVTLVIVAVVTALLAAAFMWLPIDHVTIAYLIPVIVASLRWGAIPALVAAICGIASVAYFFYAPFYDFRVHSPSQVADIVLFIVVATITGRMAAKVRQAKIRGQAEALRDALIGSVSHELHTPIAAIIGSASILAQSPAIKANEHLSSLVGVVHKEGERLNSDIQNLLDSTRINSENIGARQSWIDPEDIISGALDRKQPLLQDRPVTLAVADDLPLVYADPALMERALGHVIENAVKYSPAGSPIMISAEQGGGDITIEVSDEGEGLAFGEAERIFERFYRSPRVASTTAGSGLGLWIARALIEDGGGRIRAYGRPTGRGTTFRIDLPIRAQPASDESADD